MKTENEQPQEATTGGNAELNALAGQVAAVDGEHAMPAGDGTQAAGEPQAVDYAQEARATVDMFAALLNGYCPPTAELWNEHKKTAIAATLAPVMSKYQFSMGQLPVELVLAVTAGPVLWQSARMIAAQTQREKAAAKVAQVEAPKTQASGDMDGGPTQGIHPQAALYK